MPSQAVQMNSATARSYPSLSWCIAATLLACLIIFMIAGEYRAQSITPPQDILYDSMLRGSSSGSLISQSIVPESVSSSTDKDVCNSASQRLGHELQALLWTMTVDRTVISPQTSAPPVTAIPAPVEDKPVPDFSAIDPAWKPLIARLVRDGFDDKLVLSLYASLGPKSYSPAYMAAKVQELYGVQGVGIRQTSASSPMLPDDYKQPLTDFTLGSCVSFMKKHAAVLKDIEKKHGVQADVIVGLLLIETGLGTDLGNHSAFRALSSMALTTNATLLGSGGNAKQIKHVRANTLAATLRDKSNWAYKEVKALIRYSQKNKLDIAAIPGSIYGAIGICQFMPSNIAPFAKDGDKDGKVDVFNVVDAMYSVANYLEGHGWRGARNEAAKLSVIRAYNKDNIYAANVLGASKQLTLAKMGKISHQRHALAGLIRPRASSRIYLDPSLRNLKPVPESAKVRSLSNYHAGAF